MPPNCISSSCRRCFPASATRRRPWMPPRREMGKGTLLFVDEVHRFNRAQQDSFLPVMEDGTVVLVGATTENPSFELNAALLSRARVLVFHSLDPAAVEKLFVHAEDVEGRQLPLDA